MSTLSNLDVIASAEYAVSYGLSPSAIAQPNTLGLRQIMFAVEDLDDTVARLRAQGSELIGEVVQYEDKYGSATCVAPRASSSR